MLSFMVRPGRWVQAPRRASDRIFVTSDGIRRARTFKEELMRNRLHLAVFPCLLTLIALLAVSACTGGKRDSSGPAPDTLTIHLPVPVLTANPLTYVYSHERWVIHYTHASLYILDKVSMTMQPELAASRPEISTDKL